MQPRFLFLLLFTFFFSCENAPAPEKKVAAEVTVDDNFTKEKQAMADQVKAEFVHAWNGYKKYAWGMDGLKPLTKQGSNWYEHSLLMTPIDAYDTMLLMDLEDEAKECKKLILEKLTFDYDMEVQVFEIVIRILGGLIAAYQMDGDPKFLELAKDLGDRLLPAFETPTKMPYRMVNLATGATSDHLNNPAEIGTLQLEFAMLSKLTGDDKYRAKADQAMQVLYDKRSPETNLVGTVIDVDKGTWNNTDSHISGMIDSYYEYLLKMAILFEDDDYRKKYDESIKGVNKYLLDKTESGWWYSHVNMDTGERIRTQFGALDAFMPAMLALGGDLETAKQVQASCYKFWKENKIEPEQYDYAKGEVLSGAYYLRPENIESAAYLFHHTGDKKYFEMGKTMFESIVKYCKTEDAYAELEDIRTMEKKDDMQSFFLAETMKYAFLLASDQKKLDFKNTIFNTEAHPMQKTW
ncbi:MAG: glycoside hydrolase family 47 protein [Bacteroidota bacterium]